MLNRAAKTPVLIDKSNKYEKLNRVLLSSETIKEKWLQDLLAKNPSILPTGDVDPTYSPLFLIGREIMTPNGRIDNLYVTPNGHLVIVETKLWSNPEARRAVVGQIIEYAKAVKTWDYENVNRAYKEYHKTKTNLFDALVAAGHKDNTGEIEFVDTLTKNIHKSRFLLMIVGDGIRENVEELLESTSNMIDMHHNIALCELEIYKLGTSKIVIPHLTAHTKVVTRGVISIEDGSIKVENTEEELSTPVNTHNKKLQTDEEFIKNYIKSHPNTDAEQISNFMDAIRNLGFYINYGEKSIIIHLPNIAPLINISFKDNWFVPIKIMNALKRRGYSELMANSLFADLKPFIKHTPRSKSKPYDKLDVFYFLDENIITSKREAFLNALESFKNKF